jgi:DMSO/TMAO reductase YedYZ heme-binding membrane subunit
VKDPLPDKLILLANGLVPLAILGWDLFNSQAGADPITVALHTTGVTALVFLLLTLAITPLRKITGWNYLSNFRRMLGLFSFLYAFIHVEIYIVYQQQWDIVGVFRTAMSKPFIFFGMGAFLLMIPLAATSTNGIIKRMGGKRWKRLHTLIYPCAVAGAIHYYMAVKADERWPPAFMFALLILLLLRPVLTSVPVLRRKTT